MENNTEKFGVVVIGSGLGGLVSALILAKEGKKVCILEKNSQFGGNLQTFSRNKTLFDTGVHYLPALAEGQILNQYFTYLGIQKHLKIKQMPSVYDVVTFENDKLEYPHAQGRTDFVKSLSVHFPKEQKALEQYVTDLEQTCQAFPLYQLSHAPKEPNAQVALSVQAYFDQLTNNNKLKAVLMGSNFLYAGNASTTPFYVHALTVNAYLQSAWKCTQGGSQLTKALLKQLKSLGAKAIQRQEVERYIIKENQIIAVETNASKRVEADIFIANIDPKQLLKNIGADHFRKVYYNRIQQLPVTVSSFSVHVVLKPKSIIYVGHNVFYHQKESSVAQAMDYEALKWPMFYMLSMTEDRRHPGYAESLTLLTYMRFDEVEQWQHSMNTQIHQQDRGDDYEKFKQEKIAICLRKLAERMPRLETNIMATYASTPLSYRDYIGVHRGNLYGHLKDVQNPMQSFIAPKTKLKNLYLTGQGVNMHGILGVTIGAVATCSEIVGKIYLVDKIKSEIANKS